MTNRGKFNEFLRREFDRLRSMSDYAMADAVKSKSLDDTAYELFQIFLKEQNYDLFVIPKGKLAIWFGSSEEIMVESSEN